MADDDIEDVDVEVGEEGADGEKKKRTFKKFTFRGKDLETLMDMSLNHRFDELMALLSSRCRRRFIKRGISRKHKAFMAKLRKMKKEAAPGEKPAPVKTHLRDTIVVPEMIGSVIGVYNGKQYGAVEVKPEMIGHYLAEFSCTYKPTTHGRPGIGATNASRFIPLK
jgi:small subunit ribosomal protein S15e